MVWSPPRIKGLQPRLAIAAICLRIISTVAARLYVLMGISPMSAIIRLSNGAAPVTLLYGRSIQDSALICLGPRLQNKTLTSDMFLPTPCLFQSRSFSRRSLFWNSFEAASSPWPGSLTRGGGEGNYSLITPNGDVPLDEVEFLRLDWLL